MIAALTKGADVNDQIAQMSLVLSRTSATVAFSAAGAALGAALGILFLGTRLAPLCALIGGGAGAYYGAKKDLA